MGYNTIIYILLFALATVIVYIWGLKKTVNRDLDLANHLYSKGKNIILRELKHKKGLSKAEIEFLMKGISSRNFMSRNRAIVNNPKVFTNSLLNLLLEEKSIEEVTEKGKKLYRLPR